MDALKQIRKPVEQEMTQYRKVFESLLVHSNPLLNEALRMVSQRQGKMMRPMLVLLSAKLAGEVNDRSIYAACTFEFFHTASLLHDDVVDESDMRRGQASVNSAYGNQVAVLVGDYLLANSLLCASKTEDPRIVNIFSKAAQSLANGELLQLDNVHQTGISEDVYFDIIKNKTAALFSACAKAGIMSVSSDEMMLEKLFQFGETLGICFQIRDDIFDYNDDASIGKPTGNDMKEGKLTLPVIYAINATKNQVMTELVHKVKNGEATSEDIKALVAFTKENGGIEYAVKVMNDYAQKAKDLLCAFADSDVKQALCSYVDYVVGRTL